VNALTLEGVEKSYGKLKALNGLTLSIPKGVICGLVGPNGAGKTTTYGVVGGLVQPDSGRIDILGSGPFEPRRHRGRVTLLPQDCALNPHTPVRDLLRFYARLQGMTAGEANREADQALDQVALSDRAGSKIRQLSHGMRRRVAVAQALLGSPELVLLDEPTSGLDPELVARMREIFTAQRGRCTLVISSHVLVELEAVCDHVIFMEAGRCVSSGSLMDLTGQRSAVRVLLESPVDLAALRAALPGVTAREDGAELTLVVPDGESVSAFNRRALAALLALEAEIVELRRGRSLESAWLARARQPHAPDSGS